jgi:hypothetical protein
MLTDVDVARELEEIGARLAALASDGGNADVIGAELGAIRAQLRVLAQENAEVGARLAVVLGLEAPPLQ